MNDSNHTEILMGLAAGVGRIEGAALAMREDLTEIKIAMVTKSECDRRHGNGGLRKSRAAFWPITFMGWLKFAMVLLALLGALTAAARSYILYLMTTALDGPAQPAAQSAPKDEP